MSEHVGPYELGEVTAEDVAWAEWFPEIPVEQQSDLYCRGRLRGVSWAAEEDGMTRRWDCQGCLNPWLSLGAHVDHTDPSITLHLPGLILAIGRLKQPGFRGCSGGFGCRPT